MDNMGILVESYNNEISSRKKDRILLQIFNAYKPLILKLCKQYRGIEEPEVITQHIHLAIALALEDILKFNNARAAIFSYIKRELIEHIIRPYYKIKTSVGKDIPFSDCMRREEGYIHEIEDKSSDKIEEAVTRIDLDEAIEKLPSRECEIIRLWLQGYSLKEIKAFMNIASELYSPSVYYYFKKARKHLITLLPGYAHG